MDSPLRRDRANGPAASERHEERPADRHECPADAVEDREAIKVLPIPREDSPGVHQQYRSARARRSGQVELVPLFAPPRCNRWGCSNAFRLPSGRVHAFHRASSPCWFSLESVDPGRAQRHPSPRSPNDANRTSWKYWSLFKMERPNGQADKRNRIHSRRMFRSDL